MKRNLIPVVLSVLLTAVIIPVISCTAPASEVNETYSTETGSQNAIETEKNTSFSAEIPSQNVSSTWENASYYTENEWNFVDKSMDISKGIPEDASGVFGSIQRSGILRVATQPEQPPFTFTLPGKTGEEALAGADILLARQIAQYMGVELKLLPMDSMQVLAALTEEQCDLSISAVSYTPNRALSYTMSKSYYIPDDGPQIGIIINKRNRKQFQTLSDLENQIIITQSNSLAETVGAANITNYLEFRRTPSVQGVYEAVQEKSADAGLVDIGTAETYIRNNPDCGLLLIPDLVFSPETPYQGFRVAAKKGETQLIYFVNGVIDEILQNGSYEKWLEEARNLPAQE